MTFSLVAGFSFNGHIRCSESDSDVITTHFKYPFSSYSYSNDSKFVSASLPYSKVNSGSQFFVAIGVLSLFYCLIALAVYMLLTANEHLEKVVDMLVYVVSSITNKIRVDLGKQIGR